MTLFKILIAHCGLSQREAAAFLGTTPSRIDNLSRGKTQAGDDYINRLLDLAAKIEDVAETILAKSLASNVDVITLTPPQTDDDAAVYGLPCIGAWQAMAGFVITGSDIDVVLAD